MYKLSWIILILNLVLAIALGIFPHISSSKTQKVNPLPFYIFAGLITLSSLGQATEKSISLIKNRRKLNGQDFVQKYTGILIEAVNTITLLPLEPSQIEKAQQSLLKSICILVKLYYEERKEVQINANLMIPCEIKNDMPLDRFKQEVKFIDPLRQPNTYQCLLKLTLWTEPIEGVSLNFMLPVDKDHQRLLFGAPKAYILGTNIIVEDISNDTEINKIITGHPQIVASEIRQFLKEMKYKSFISLPLILSNKTIGIVNIQSNKPYILGREQDKIEELKRYIAPLISILTLLTSPRAVK